MKTKLLLFCILAMFPSLLFAQYDFGDAPEGVLAYPLSGQNGLFPTCKTVGPNGWVQHMNFGAFFFSVDLEIDGNQGLCPNFSPYDLDECYADVDAGLVIPQPFTIVGGKVVTCPASLGTSLGPVCTTVSWGNNIDINVQNLMPSQATGYVNVLIDWNQNGEWGDSITCPQGTVSEHVLVNHQVLNPYTGLLSASGPPPFTTGPTTGYFWSRFSISEKPVIVNWEGGGNFEDGESEDYLIYVGGYDMGDAPEGSLAYPATGVTGIFPTCMNVGAPNSEVKHFLGSSFFGPGIDTEMEGNADSCPNFNPNNYDRDECWQDSDAGLIFPGPYTITGAVGSEVVVPCTQTASALGKICQTLVWGTDIDINVTGMGYVNVLMDWDQDGIWSNNPNMICQGVSVPEHVLVNFPVSGAINFPLSTFSPPSFQAGAFTGYVWARLTISDQMVTSNWDGSGTFLDGESEDYLLEVIDSTVSIKHIPGDGTIQLKIEPNPVTDQSNFEFVLLDGGNVRIEVVDMQGKSLGNLFEGIVLKGKHSFSWNEGNLLDGSLQNGIYMVRLIFNDRFSGFTRIVVIH